MCQFSGHPRFAKLGVQEDPSVRFFMAFDDFRWSRPIMWSGFDYVIPRWRSPSKLELLGDRVAKCRSVS